MKKTVFNLIICIVLILSYVIIAESYFNPISMFGYPSPYIISPYGYSPFISQYAYSSYNNGGQAFYTYASSATLSQNLDTNLENSTYVSVTRSSDGSFKMGKVSNEQGLLFIETCNCEDVVSRLGSLIDSLGTIAVKKRTVEDKTFYDIYSYYGYTPSLTTEPYSQGPMISATPYMNNFLPVIQVQPFIPNSAYYLPYQSQYTYFGPSTYMNRLPNSIADIYTFLGPLGLNSYSQPNLLQSGYFNSQPIDGFDDEPPRFSHSTTYLSFDGYPQYPMIGYGLFGL